MPRNLVAVIIIPGWLQGDWHSHIWTAGQGICQESFRARIHPSSNVAWIAELFTATANASKLIYKYLYAVLRRTNTHIGDLTARTAAREQLAVRQVSREGRSTGPSYSALAQKTGALAAAVSHLLMR